MYRYDWIEQLKLRGGQGAMPTQLSRVSPVVWALGLTSFLTDISSEMVNSILPVYLVLHLRLSPLQYGAIDGIYNGLSVAIASICAGVLADRLVRWKEVAAAGYGLSAVCKLLLVGVAGAWTWIAVIVGLDRLGKGIRTAPRDALLSLHTPAGALGTAFGVHRAMDSAGALLGPLVAVALLAQLPGDFTPLWLVSFIVAVLGVAALLLFVPKNAPSHPAPAESQPLEAARLPPHFVGLVVGATVLATVTISDGFVYLLLREKTGTDASLLPLFFVVTAASYMLFSIPVGMLADRLGRARVFIAGYVVLVILYLLLWSVSTIDPVMQAACLLLLGLYYAATEGVLMAAASGALQRQRRATGLAILATGIGFGRLVSSLAFGWLSQMYGASTSVVLFAAALPLVATVCGVWFHARRKVYA